MKALNKIFLLGVLSVTMAFMPSCRDYLDVSSEIEATLDIEKIFNNPIYAKRWHSTLFRHIPNYSNVGVSWGAPFGNSWNYMAGEAISRTKYMIGGFNSSTAIHHRWKDVYAAVRDIHIFMNNIKPLGFANDTERLTQANVDRMVAEAKFLEALYYFLLFEQYGPVPIVSTIESPNNKEIDFARASVDELVTYIDGLLQEVIDSGDLPQSIIINKNSTEESSRYNFNEMLRPTVTCALALRAKLWVFAASPLYNGKYDEAVALTDKTGKNLFPAYDESKWVTAKGHLEALFRDVDAKGHKLYEFKGEDGLPDPHQSVYRLFQNYNDEILWAMGNNEYNGSMEQNTTPYGVYWGWAAVGSSQNSVDEFFCSDGLSINESPQYSEDKFVDVINPCNEDKRTDPGVWSMYANREPRFYAAISYQGKSWHIQPENKPNYQNGFAKGGESDNSQGNHPYGGYLLYKFKNRRVLSTGTEWHNRVRSWARPAIIFRLADFYLYYAEVCNEISASDTKVIEYLDKIRTRAGIAGYRELAASGKKNIIGDPKLQREAIQHERHIELFAEGQRYFDIRRWMICGKDQSAQQYKVYALDMEGNAETEIGKFGSYFRRIVLEDRPWIKAMYLYPIQFDEIQKSKLLVQNPLWD